MTERKIEVARFEDGRVLRVMLAQPKANILDVETLAAVQKALLEAQPDPKLKMVLLRGAGAHFSFGASVQERRPDGAPAMLERLHALVQTVAAYPVPVAVSVEGRCLGTAFELALAAHFVFAKLDAVFACPEIKLGHLPTVLPVVGPHRLPGALVERLMLTGEEIDAATATTFGFVTGIVANTGNAEQATLEWYRARLAPLSAFALRQATAAARPWAQGLAAELSVHAAQYLKDVVTSADAHEGLEAFVAKRPPEWRDG